MTVSVPPPHREELPDEAYRRMTFVLRTGLLAALALLLAALGAYFLRNPGASSGSVLSANPIAPYLSLAGLAHGLWVGAPEAYLALGVFVLVATPILRVATGVYYFHRGHERTMALVTGTVLLLLVLGVLVIGPLIR